MGEMQDTTVEDMMEDNPAGMMDMETVGRLYQDLAGCSQEGSFVLL
jgi:hypothetical protein